MTFFLHATYHFSQYRSQYKGGHLAELPLTLATHIDYIAEKMATSSLHLTKYKYKLCAEPSVLGNTGPSTIQPLFIP